MRCPSCQAEHPEAAKFCMECGSALVAVCAACSHRNPPSARFCMECGSPFAARPSSPPPAPVEAPVPPPPSAPPAPPEPSAPAPQAYTPQHLVDKILTSRSVLEGERKQVTVLFADIKGSTELIQTLDDAEEAQTLLDGAVQVMMEAVHRFEGTVNHILGDGIMALFGAPLAHEDHAVRACYAALAMQEAIERHAEDTLRRHGIAVRIRVGLNSGEVVVRAIANDLRMDYSAIGQTVNLAARMEQNAREGTILLTPATLRFAEEYVEVRSLGPIPVKGVAEPIEVFELVGTGRIQTRLEAAAARGLTRFVGRQAELDRLDAVFDRAAGGHGQVVAIVGEPGTGKSRLIWELTHSSRTEGWLVLETGSIAYTRATPYLPVIELLKAYCRVEDRDDRRAMREKVIGTLVALDGGADEALEPVLPAILALLDVPVEDPEWQALDPPQRRRRTQEAVKRLFLRESVAQPLLLIVENIHWIDAETRALLDSLVESLPTARLVLLVSYRTEYQHDWSAQPRYTELPLEPLRGESAAELIRALLGDDRDLAPLEQRLIEQTRGNPFFLEECVRSLAETGALVGEPGAYRLEQALPSIRVPPTVQAVLAARIDRLPPEEKRLLQSAAVVGAEVPIALLKAIAELPADEVQPGLSRLQAAGFLYESNLFPETEYTFIHALTHGVAYDSLLQQRRRALHTRIVDAIEALYPERLVEHVERLAHHAFAGEAWNKALRYYRQAAAKSVARAAYRAAVGNLELALDAVGHLPSTPELLADAVDIHLELRSSLTPLGELQSIHDHLRQAEGLAQGLDDRRRLARTFSYLCAYFSIMRDPDQAVQFGERALALASNLGDLKLQVPAAFFLGEAHYSLGAYREGVVVLRRNAAVLQGDQQYERFGMTGLPAVLSRGMLALCLAELGEFADGSAAAGEAIQIAEAVSNNPFSLAHACSSDGFVHLVKGDLTRAIHSLERCVELCHTRGLSLYAPAATSRLGHAYVLSGKIAEGLPLLEHAAERAESIGRLYEQASMMIWLSEAYLLADRPEPALDLARRAFLLADLSKQRGKRAHALCVLGQVHAERGLHDIEQAESYYRESLALAEELGMRPLQAHCDLGLGTLYRRTGRFEDARPALSRAVQLFRSLGMTFWQPGAEGELARAAPPARVES